VSVLDLPPLFRTAIGFDHVACLPNAVAASRDATYPFYDTEKPSRDYEPQSPYATAMRLITEHGAKAEDYAAAEMANWQAVGDGDSYANWGEIYDAVAKLRGSEIGMRSVRPGRSSSASSPR
jgi:hypothetical protein